MQDRKFGSVKMHARGTRGSGCDDCVCKMGGNKADAVICNDLQLIERKTGDRKKEEQDEGKIYAPALTIKGLVMANHSVQAAADQVSRLCFCTYVTFEFNSIFSPSRHATPQHKRNETQKHTQTTILNSILAVLECGLAIAGIGDPHGTRQLLAQLAKAGHTVGWVGWSPGWGWAYLGCGLFSYFHIRSSLVADTMDEAVGGQGRIIKDGQNKKKKKGKKIDSNSI